MEHIERRYVAENGAEVYYLPAPGLHKACITLYVRGGVLHETPEENGITHFLEHIHFRSLNRLAGGKLYRLLDSWGASFNACTYKEFMDFSLAAHPARFRDCASIFARLLAPLAAVREDVDIERKRIRQEISGSGESAAQRLREESVWGDTALSAPVPGTPASVGNITLKRMKAKKRQLFVRGNLFFYLTGRVAEEDLQFFLREISAYPLGEGAGNFCNLAPLPAAFFRRRPDVYVRKSPDCSACLSFDLRGGRDPETDVLYDLLFTGLNSRFYIGLSEDNGFVYDFDSYLEQYANLGNLNVVFQTSPEKLYAALSKAVEILSESKAGFGADEVGELLAWYPMDAETLLDEPANLAWTLASLRILGKSYASVEAWGRRNAGVTPQSLARRAREIFAPQNLTLTLCGDPRRIDLARIRGIVEKL